MPWLLLVLAGCCEIGWPLGLKLGWSGKGIDPKWIAFAAFSMTLSGVLLFLAQRAIPIGTAYAVWTGIGAVGTFLVGIYAFGDAATLLRFAGVGLIAAGIITLKLA